MSSETPGAAAAAAAGAEAREHEAALRQALRSRTIDFAEVVRLKHMRTLAGKDEQQLRSIGERYYDRALAAFKLAHGGAQANVSIFSAAGSGVYALPDGEFKWTVLGRAIDFDWSAAHQLANRVSAVVEQAQEWWGPDEGTADAAPPTARRTQADGEHGDPAIGRQPSPSASDARPPDAGAQPAPPSTAEARPPDARPELAGPAPPPAQPSARARARASQLRPHVERAYGETTAIFSAVNLESLRRKRNHVKLDEPSSREFLANLAVIEPQVVRMERLLEAAGQQSAKQRYSLGMLAGLALLTALCGGLAWAFAVADLPAWYGVAFPAGGIGAVVSVLTRMTSGRLRLDVHAGRGMLAVYGAVRPFVGAISGMVVFVLIVGGLLPEIHASGPPLAFYTAIGFFAGFSERFAQDMLATASRGVGAQPPSDDAAQTAPAAPSAT